MMAGRMAGLAALLSAAFGLLGCSTPLSPLPTQLPLVSRDATQGPALPSVFNPADLGMTLAELRERYPNLQELGDPTNVEYRGATRSVDLAAGCLDFDKSGGCRSPSFTIDKTGGGTAVLATYYVPARYEGFTAAYLFPDTRGVLAPIFIFVCLDVPGQGDRAIPSTVAQVARVCGFQGFHHTYLSEYMGSIETLAESAERQSPMYERVFDGLVSLYGKPQDYEKHGKITIILGDGSRYSSDRAARYIDYHWGKGVSETNLDYSFDPRSGQGIVYVSSPMARFYADRRHDMGDVNFMLWKIHQQGGMNRREFESQFQSGSLAATLLEARVERSYGVSARERELFAPQTKPSPN